MDDLWAFMDICGVIFLYFFSSISIQLSLLLPVGLPPLTIVLWDARVVLTTKYAKSFAYSMLTIIE